MQLKIDFAIKTFFQYLKVEKSLSNNTIISYQKDLSDFSLYLANEKILNLNDINNYILNNYIHQYILNYYQ